MAAPARLNHGRGGASSPRLTAPAQMTPPGPPPVALPLAGSGIFVVPALVAGGTGSVGGSLLLWAFGGLISTCGLMVWLQLGLSLPLLRTGRDHQFRAVPRSGGEKNYVRYECHAPPSLC